MHASAHHGKPPAQSQQGFVLLVALILLLVMTVLGLAASQSSSLEERMAGNERNQNLAFQAAEAGLRAGEFCLGTGMAACTTYSNATTGGNGAYRFNATNTVTLWAQANFWTTAGNTLSYATIAGQNLPRVAAQPEFVVESLPPVGAPGCNISQQNGYGQPSAASNVERWRITARGTGGDKSSIVMVQEIIQVCH